MRCLTKWVVAGSVALIWVCLASAQDKSVSPGINKPFLAPSVTEFQGKFEKEGREAFDNREAIVKECKLKPGMVVADVGAGTGLFSRLFAAEVGESGKVFAVDIAKEFVEHVELSARQAKLKNVVGIVCKPDSVELAEGSMDVVFLCDTYHYFEFPEKTMKSIHRALRPGGRVVLVDYRRIPGKSTEWVLGHVRAGQDVVEKEITACGFRRTREVEGLLKENYLVEFEKVDGK